MTRTTRAVLASIGAVTLALAACLPLAGADTQTNNTSIRCASKGPYYGRTDGVCLETDTKAPGLVLNGTIDQMFNSALYVGIEEDFLGARVINDTSDTDDVDQSPWASEDTATAGCPAIKADFDSGALELLLDNGSEVGDCDLNFGDELSIDSDTEPFCIYRAQIQTAPAAADTLFWGFTSAQNDLINSTTINAGFSVAGADLNLDVMSDDNSTDVNATDTTVDLVAGTFYEFMVSANSMHGVTATDTDGASPTDVHFFYRAALGGDWTQLLPNTTFSMGADKAIQPAVHIEKTSGTSTPDLLVDYVKCYWERT